jgi:hypothetical protein
MFSKRNLGRGEGREVRGEGRVREVEMREVRGEK